MIEVSYLFYLFSCLFVPSFLSLLISFLNPFPLQTLINLSCLFPWTLPFICTINHCSYIHQCATKQCQHNLINVLRLQQPASPCPARQPPSPRSTSRAPCRQHVDGPTSPHLGGPPLAFSTPPPLYKEGNLWRQGNAHACHHIMHTHPLGTPIEEYPQYSQNKHHLWEFWYFSSIKTQGI